MKTIRIMNFNWLQPVYLEAIEDRETLGRYGLQQPDVHVIVDAWKNAPLEEGMTVREWSYSAHGDTFTTALYDAGELSIDYWTQGSDGLYWTDEMPFDFEVSEEDSSMSHELRVIIRNALEAGVSSQLYGALLSVADEFHITYTFPEKNVMDWGAIAPSPTPPKE